MLSEKKYMGENLSNSQMCEEFKVSGKLLIDFISLSSLITKNKRWKGKNISAEFISFAFQ